MINPPQSNPPQGEQRVLLPAAEREPYAKNSVAGGSVQGQKTSLLYSLSDTISIPDLSARKRKRNTVTVACNHCRARKSGCDGKRPSCTPCATRGVTCVFVTARDLNLSTSGSEPWAVESQNVALRKENESLRQQLEVFKQLWGSISAALEGNDSEDVIECLRGIQDPKQALRRLMARLKITPVEKTMNRLDEVGPRKKKGRRRMELGEPSSITAASTPASSAADSSSTVPTPTQISTGGLPYIELPFEGLTTRERHETSDSDEGSFEEGEEDAEGEDDDEEEESSDEDEVEETSQGGVEHLFSTQQQQYPVPQNDFTPSQPAFMQSQFPSAFIDGTQYAQGLQDFDLESSEYSAIMSNPLDIPMALVEIPAPDAYGHPTAESRIDGEKRES